MEELLKTIDAKLDELLRRTRGTTTPAGEIPLAHDPREGLVETPRGRWFPKPRPDQGEMFMAYTVRVGESQGVKQLAINVQGSLFIAATPLFAKHGGYKEDGSNWAAAAEDWLFPVPVAPDPGWDAVHNNMGGR